MFVSGTESSVCTTHRLVDTLVDDLKWELGDASQEKRAAKQANEGGHAPGMELATLEQQQQQQQGLPHDADAAARAAAEGAAVQGVLDGALPQVLCQLGPSGCRV